MGARLRNERDKQLLLPFAKKSVGRPDGCKQQKRAWGGGEACVAEHGVFLWRCFALTGQGLDRTVQAPIKSSALRSGKRVRKQYEFGQKTEPNSAELLDISEFICLSRLLASLRRRRTSWRQFPIQISAVRERKSSGSFVDQPGQVSFYEKQHDFWTDRVIIHALPCCHQSSPLESSEPKIL